MDKLTEKFYQKYINSIGYIKRISRIGGDLNAYLKSEKIITNPQMICRYANNENVLIFWKCVVNEENIYYVEKNPKNKGRTIVTIYMFKEREPTIEEVIALEELLVYVTQITLLENTDTFICKDCGKRIHWTKTKSKNVLDKIRLATTCRCGCRYNNKTQLKIERVVW